MNRYVSGGKLRHPNLFEKLIFLMFTLSLPVDMFSGYLIQYEVMNLSMYYKIALLFVSLYYIIKMGCYGKLLIGISSLLVLFLIHSLMGMGTTSVVYGLVYAIKFFSLYIFYMVFSQFIKKGYEKRVVKVAVYSFIFLSVNILVGMVGIGFPMYGNGENAIGTSGLIYAGNELGVAFTTCSSIVLTLFLLKNNYTLFYTLGVGMLALATAMTLKVPVFSVLIILFVFPLIKLVGEFRGLAVSRKTFFCAGSVLVIVPLMAISSFFYIIVYSGLSNRIESLYTKLDFFGMILSGRNVWLVEGLDIFTNNYTIAEKIFGSGHNWVSNISEKKIIEIDFADFLLFYGIFGLTLLFLFIFNNVLKTIRFLKTNPVSCYVLTSKILIIFISLLAGHVFWSGTAGYLVALLFSLGISPHIENMRYEKLAKDGVRRI